MKLYKTIMATAMAVVVSAGFTGCDNDFAYPPVVCPDLGGNGAWDAPLSVDGAKAYYSAFYSDAPETDTYYWVTGYIVGCVTTTETVFVADANTSEFKAPFGTNNNMLLAATPDETNYENCIALQLPSGDVRNGLGLNSNPGNAGKLVTVYGYIDKYLGLPGMRSITMYQWGDRGVDTGEYPTPVSEFTLASEITSGRAYALGALTVNGRVVSANLALPLDAESGFLQVSSKYINGESFSAKAKYGFVLTECGENIYYINDFKGHYLYAGTYGAGYSNRPSSSAEHDPNNSAYTWRFIKQEDNSWLIYNVASGGVLMFDKQYSSYGLYKTTDGYVAPCLYEMAIDPLTPPTDVPENPENPENPDTPDTPDTPDGVIYQGLLPESADCDWTFDNVVMNDPLTYIWSWKTYQGSSYLNASAYLNGANPSEGYAYTTLDLSEYKTVTLTFDHAAKFQTTLKEFCRVAIRETGSTAWTLLEIPEWPASGAWTFAPSGTIDLSALAGKKVDLGLKYGSSTAGADTWEIKNFIVNAAK